MAIFGLDPGVAGTKIGNVEVNIPKQEPGLAYPNC